MDTTELDTLIAALPAGDRRTVATIARTVERIVDHLGDVTHALEGLNKLDDLRQAEINELRLTVRLLCEAQGLETHGEPLAAAIARYLTPQPQSLNAAGDKARQLYWDQLAELRRQREEASPDA